MAGEKILIVEDEPEIADLIKLYLKKEGFVPCWSASGATAVETYRREKPELVILDVLLPELDGLEVCRQLRKETNCPIIFLSCKGLEMDKVLGLAIGADDYVTKPFSPSELLARVKAQLRRSRVLHQGSIPAKPEDSPCQVLKFPALEIDFRSHEVKFHNKPVSLSAKEFQLLALLARNPNQVLTTEQIFDRIWGYDHNGDTRTVMVHIRNLRKKVEEDPSCPKRIVTVRGVGYKFIEQVTP
ncbi:MAG: response regulator transcription factor [Clostridia bacterium]|nr:response regulator transcription factor [Clostridia bacterium]